MEFINEIKISLYLTTLLLVWSINGCVEKHFQRIDELSSEELLQVEEFFQTQQCVINSTITK